ncbi:glycosyltransferase family 39 protein [Sphingomonas sp. So64.6b]|uniref:glycosyltransferase family 39 protein n=1 Tax=Sphingomonas sp. So64.6b TaxID=2997354 RepID=UPI0016039E25|nr:glycosyltransferase family 39 protein [Sphingomonas sp. So64.6b]QNA83645.1 glycosyltransferase family 39 protein [Sphingomonas sp. So64.6b]
MAARASAMVVLEEPLLSDSAAYFEMARTLLAPGPMRDTYGNAAFYSPGYPFAMALAFAIGGVKLGAALALNLALGAISTLLVYLLARRATADGLVALIAAASYAVLIPAVAGSAFLLRENLSVPLLLGFTLAAVLLLDTRRPKLVSAVSGVLYGAGMLAGASVILTGAAVAVALLWRRESLLETAVAALAFAAGAALILGPWVVHVDRTLGRPVLTTNGPFNLYIGNNPAADGRFVSMKDTPLGARWRTIRADYGELRATDFLGAQAMTHIQTHPVQTGALALRKLALFWVPDFPDSEDRSSPVVTALRWADVLQFTLILAFAVLAMAQWRRRTRAERLILVTIGCFWAIHAAAYVMPRYRLPVMPLLIISAASVALPLIRRPLQRGDAVLA